MSSNHKNIPQDFWAHFIKNPSEAERLVGDPVAGAIAIEEVRWPDGIVCPSCESKDIAPFGDNDRVGKRRYRCRPCARQFNFRHGTFMAGSKFTADRFIFAVTVAHNEGLERARERLNAETSTNYVSVDNLVAKIAEVFELEIQTPQNPKRKRPVLAGAAVFLILVAGGFFALRGGVSEAQASTLEGPAGSSPLVEKLLYDAGPKGVETFLVTPSEGFSTKSEWVAAHAARVHEINHDNNYDR